MGASFVRSGQGALEGAPNHTIVLAGEPVAHERLRASVADPAERARGGRAVGLGRMLEIPAELADEAGGRMQGHHWPDVRRYRASGDLARSEEHTSELQSPDHLVCRLLLEKKKNIPKWPVNARCRALYYPRTCVIPDAST